MFSSYIVHNIILLSDSCEQELHAFSRLEQIVMRGGSGFMCQILLILSFKSEEVYFTCHHWRGTMVLRS